MGEPDQQLRAWLKAELASLQQALTAEFRYSLEGVLTEQQKFIYRQERASVIRKPAEAAASPQTSLPPSSPLQTVCETEHGASIGSRTGSSNEGISIDVDDLVSTKESFQHLRARLDNHHGNLVLAQCERTADNSRSTAGGSDETQGSTAFARLFGVKSSRRIHMSKRNADGAFVRLGSSLSDDQYESLDADDYDVANFYKDDGMWQAIARSELFQSGVLLVIAANAVYMGIDAEYNTEGFLWFSGLSFLIAENMFCAFFVLELLVRYLAFAHKRDCLNDMWFKFDTLLAVYTVLETWTTGLVFVISGSTVSFPAVGPLRILRLLRLARLLRLIRLARKIPEVVTLVKGLKFACRGVLSTLILMTIVNYIFALLIHSMIGKEENKVRDYFETLPLCMWTLLVQGTFMDNTTIVLVRLRNNGGPNSTIALTLFLAYIALTAFALLNLLVGILCEVVTKVTTEERNETVLRMMKKTILKELKAYDIQGNGQIGSDELTAVLQSEKSRSILQRLHIDMEYVRDFRSLLASAQGGDTMITIKQAMELLLLCRGDQATTVSSISVAARLTHAIIEQAFHRHRKDLRSMLTTSFSS